MTLATVPRYDADRISRVGERAVVVGASVAGLLAGRVLADAFDEVVVLERDSLSGGDGAASDSDARRGTPQAEHVHVLLEAGRATIEDLLPGYCEDLLTAGGVALDASRDLHYYDRGDFLADGPERLPMYCASRPLFERTVRERVAALDPVTVRAGCRFTDYLADDAGTAVEGVAFAAEDGDGEATELDADLVVDATGRTSRTPDWLERRGYDPPAVEEVTVDLSYSTAVVERPPGERRGYLVTPSPSVPRGGTAVPIEGDRWIVTLFGLHGDHPPGDPEGFRAFADGLPTPEIGRLLDDHEWASGSVDQYPFASSRRRRYEDLDRFPDGLVVTGDAVASFNPIYGQGMSAAALDALQLHHALAASGGGDLGVGDRGGPATSADLADDFFDRVAAVVDVIWQMAVSADFEFPETEGPRPRGTALSNWYVSRLVRTAHDDGVVADRFSRVLRLERPPAALLTPGVVWRVLVPNGVRRYL